LLDQLEQRPFGATAPLAAAPLRPDELRRALLIEIADGDLLLLHPAREILENGQLLSDRRTDVAEILKIRTEVIEVDAKHTRPKPPQDSGIDEHVFEQGGLLPAGNLGRQEER
jgi:hypothetical protein